jgi:polar amino acid transport system substrate-binding protein
MLLKRIWLSRLMTFAWSSIRALAIVSMITLPASPRSVALTAGIPSEIKIASEGARPPYNYLDGNELAGFEIDLGRELCARMNVKCSFLGQNWEDLLPGLISHQYDAIMAAMEITDEARGKIAFSTPYVAMPSAFMAAKGNAITSVSPPALEHKRIGVVSGGAHETYARDVFRSSEIVLYDNLEEAILDLAEGRTELVFADKDALAHFAKSRREAQCCTLVGDVPHDPAYFGEGIGIGLRREDTRLRQLFDKALAEVRADGTFAKIWAKYFDFEVD